VRLATVHPGSTTFAGGAATANGDSDRRVETWFACHFVPMVLDAIQPNGQRCDKAMALQAHRRNGSLAMGRTGHRSAQGLLLHVNRLTRCLVGGFRALPSVFSPLHHQGPRFRRNLNGNASSVAISPFAPGDTAPDDSAPAAGPVPCLGSGPDPSPLATA
jgi:hypothetical protein